MYATYPGIQRQSGITLLEVLVTVVVLSFGLLGVAGLQMASLKSTQSSYYRSIATSLGYDIIDKLHANVLSHPPADRLTTASYYVAPAAPTKNCSTVGGSACSAVELANFEIDRWNARSDGATEDGGAVARLLPAGQSVVCMDSTPYDGTSAAATGCDGAGNWVVKVWWDDSRGKLATDANDATANTAQRLVVIFTP